MSDPRPLLLAAWVLLTLATTAANGAYTPGAVVALTAGLLLAVAAGRPAGRNDAATRVALLLAAGAALVASLLYPSGLYAAGPALAASRALSGVAAGLAVAAVPARWSRPAAAGAAVAATGALVGMVRASPRPAIDVWFLLTEGSRRLLAGDNLYTSCWPGNPDPLTDCVYPYLPMTSVVQEPFRLLLGDVRYSYVAALLGAALALSAVAGRRWGPPLGVLLLVTPKTTFLVEQAWTEPLLLVALAAMVLGTVRGRPVLAVLALAGALACKQHVLLLLPLAAWWPAFGWRRTGASVLLAVAVTLPWFLVDPRAFLDDALWFNLHLPPRPDSLSLFTTALRAGLTPPFAVVGALTLAAMAGALLLPRTAAGFALGAALVQYVFDLANKQSFFNHWWLVGGLLLLAVAATGLPEPALPGGLRPGHRDPHATS